MSTVSTMLTPLGDSPDGSETPAWVHHVLDILPRTTDNQIDLAATADGLVQLLAACAASASADRTARSADELLEGSAALTRLSRSGEGLRALRLTQLSLAERVIDPTTGAARTRHHAPGWADEFTPDEVAPALALSPAASGTLLEDSRDAVFKTPQLLHLVITGQLSTASLRAATAELIEAPQSTCADVETTLLQLDITTMTPRQVRHHARRLVGLIDPPAQRQGSRRRARERLGVWSEPGPEAGTTGLTAVLPAEEAQQLYTAIDTRARELTSQGTSGTSLSQCRAHALLDLALHGVRIDTLIHLTLPVDTRHSDPQHTDPAGSTTTGQPGPGHDTAGDKHPATQAGQPDSGLEVADPVAHHGSALVRRRDGSLGHCTAEHLTTPGITGHLSTGHRDQPGHPTPGTPPPLLRLPTTHHDRPRRPDELHHLPGTTDPEHLAQRRRWLRAVTNPEASPHDGSPIGPSPSSPPRHDRNDRHEKHGGQGGDALDHDRWWPLHPVPPPEDSWRDANPWDPTTQWLRDVPTPATHPTERTRWCHHCERLHPAPVDRGAPCPLTEGLAVDPRDGAYHLTKTTRRHGRRYTELTAAGHAYLAGTALPATTLDQHDRAHTHAQRHDLPSPAPTTPLAEPSTAQPITSSLPDWVRDLEVPGIGIIRAATLYALTQLTSTTFTATLLDSSTGATLATATDRYHPTARIRRLVTERDQTCRFPGCHHPARYCDQDHVIPAPLGTTAPTNLASLCRHHHRLKHHTTWHLAMTADGICTWTSPSGTHHTTTPPAMTEHQGDSINGTGARAAPLVP